MFILGLLLIAAGALAIVVAFFGVDGANSSAELLGADLHATTIFLLGVGAGAAILWGFGIIKFGTKRSLQRRREHKRLNELSEKLDRVEAERRDDPDDSDRA